MLEKERIRLKIKQQEYEIKKSLLDLKHQYHPLNVAVRAVGDYWAAQNAQQNELTTATKQQKLPVATGIGQLLAQILGLIQNYFQFADNSLPNNAPATITTETLAPTTLQNDRYVIGEDDK